MNGLERFQLVGRGLHMGGGVLSWYVMASLAASPGYKTIFGLLFLVHIAVIFRLQRLLGWFPSDGNDDILSFWLSQSVHEGLLFKEFEFIIRCSGFLKGLSFELFVFVFDGSYGRLEPDW